MNITCIFETKRLLIRPSNKNDIDILLALFTDPEIMQYYGNCQPMSSEAVQKYLDELIPCYARHGMATGIILLKENLESIGYGGLYYEDANNKEELSLLYIFKKAHWGQGLATEFVKAALEAGLTKANRILATTMPENRASVRVLEKSGMTFKKYIPDINRRLYCIEK